MGQIIGGHSVAAWGRIDGHSLQMGRAVQYRLSPPHQFTITITREGIDVAGAMPRMGAEGVAALQAILTRAVLQHDRLKSTPLGEKQEVYTEEELAAMEAIDDAMESNAVN